MRAHKKMITVFLAVCLLVVTAVTVYAYLSAGSSTVVNEFSPASDPQPTITETFVDNVKSDVAVDVGDPGYAVYVRAAIVVTWKDANGNVYAIAPVAGTDYSITLNETDWFKKEGFYYFKEPLSSGSTEPLIKECILLDSANVPNGYSLSVEIIAQTIQALGTTDDGETPAVTAAWGIQVTDGKLSAG